MAATTFVFGQGRVRFENDSLRLVYFSPNSASLYPGDQSLAGQAVPGGGMTLSGATLVAELWAGTATDAMFAESTVGFGTTPGTLAGTNVVLPSSFPPGVTNFFQVKVYDQSAGSALAAEFSSKYFGESSIFTAVPGSLIFNSIVHSGAPAYSTWSAGSVPLDQPPSGGIFPLDQLPPGAEGAIMLEAMVPEPSLFALIGLGGAGMLLLRRR